MAKPLKCIEGDERLPPGQYLTTQFPVLSYGATPRFNLQKWDFQLIGLVEQPLRLTWDQLRQLPRTVQVSDFHCVTTWSRYDNRWEGIHVRDLIKMVTLKPEAKHVFVLCDGGYTRSESTRLNSSHRR